MSLFYRFPAWKNRGGPEVSSKTYMVGTIPRYAAAAIPHAAAAAAKISGRPITISLRTMCGYAATAHAAAATFRSRISGYGWNTKTDEQTPPRPPPQKKKPKNTLFLSGGGSNFYIL